jgi:hypothetical protein
MAVVYNNTLKDARLGEVISAIGSAGKLEICTTSYASILATIPLANPAGTASGGVLTFTMPQSDTSADNSGTAAVARIRDGSDNDIVTGLTVGTAGTDIVLGTTTITTGLTVTISSATITHG